MLGFDFKITNLIGQKWQQAENSVIVRFLRFAVTII